MCGRQQARAGSAPSWATAADSISILSVLMAPVLHLHRPTPRVEWKKKDGSLGETSGQPDKHNRWFHFKSIGLNDDGEYECKAWNSHGFTTHSFTVTVEGQRVLLRWSNGTITVSEQCCVLVPAAPYWVKEPASQLYSPGETVRLDCQAEGIPTPSITWSINGRPVPGTDAPQQTAPERMDG